jgi:uncharacterized protein (TIGR02996 family)
MADEPTLLQLVRERPTDAAARLVYADWLEQQGDHKRAAIVRAIEALGDDLDETRALLALAKRAAPEWLEAISYPPLSGTCWGTQNHAGVGALLGFRANRVLMFKRADEWFPGTWLQVGRAMMFTINKYSSHGGLVTGDAMHGVAQNRGNQFWTWGAVRLPDTALDADPVPDLAHAPRDSDYEQREATPRARASPARTAARDPAATASPAARRRIRSASRSRRSPGGKAP